MNSQPLHERIQYLERRLKQLLTRYKEQQGVLQQLQAENEQLRKRTSSTATEVPSVSNNVAVRTIIHELQQVEDWEGKLDTCIQEIDKSIAYLEQLE